MIKVEGLVKVYKNRRVVDTVSLTMNKAEVVGLLGPNGAGKTTTFYMITGLVKPDQGTISFNGQDVTALPMYQRSRLGMGYLPQESSIFKKLSVQENIFILWELLKNVPKDQFHSRLDELLEDMGILHLKHAKGVELSGGEKRRVEIVRALATDPEFILLDEPFAGIDPIAVREIQAIILRLQKKGLGIVITDHNVRETLEITNRAYLIYQGKLILSGTSKQIVEDPIAKQFYLGKDFNL